MTWLSTWQSNGLPAYREHPTEAAAAEHAKTQRAAGYPAVHFELADEEAS